jgi:hypothetical protein
MVVWGGKIKNPRSHYSPRVTLFHNDRDKDNMPNRTFQIYFCAAPTTLALVIVGAPALC